MRTLRSATITLAALVVCAAACAADEQRYQLRQEERNLFGFALGHRDGNAEFVIPFDKSYEELTPARQARLKSAYVEMGQADEPPYPLGGLKSIFEPLTQGQQRLHASGAFSADVDVDRDGRPIAVAVYRSPSRAVTAFVTRVVMLSTFKPAVCAGMPCKMGFPVRISFAMK